MVEQIATKRPADSFYEKLFRFSTDTVLRDSFVNTFGDLRFGKLLEEMDYAAGMIAYAHADGFALDLTIVTAACDRIDLLSPLSSTQDLRLTGNVYHVGRSSMEIGLRLESCVDGDWVLVVRAFFIMVALKDQRAYPVHGLLLETDEDRAHFAEATVRLDARRQENKSHFWHAPPTAEEGAQLHHLFVNARTQGLEGIHMQNTWRQTTLIMHPQNRNIHHKVFGGHIMRMAFENAYCVAHLHSRRRPFFVCVDHFDFLKSVDIGSIVSLNTMVTYTGRTSFIVEVIVDVLDPMTGRRDTTNTSHFTFVAVDELCRPTPVPPVYPLSYEEGLKYLDGAKRHKRGKLEREERKRRT